ncbi:hypothetical protein F2Q68_00010480 [Brassica cretica]|uniref:Uncharacterized protein n=1 Tax=Brassica cretica TaxID=69181 RepID=A0A8S9KR33_BRACR|nr:hypothetical protein F2Q68_00010480 [Brassica cretica]
MASGRERLRNLAAATHPTYGETFLDRTDRSASSSGAASAQEHVPESQSQGRSSAQEYVPPAQYELPPYYPQYEADYQPQMTRDAHGNLPIPHTSGQIPHACKPFKLSANRVISELRADSQANRIHIRSIAGMFEVLAETNPALAAMWQNVRPTINPDPTLEEQADLEQRSSVHHSAEIFDDINLNN